MKNYNFSENAGFLGYKMSLSKKLSYYSFVAQSTDPPIKNGVFVKKIKYRIL